MEKLDCVVVGAGVVGLAIARRMAIAGREVTVLEQASRIGTGISARNSEVIHAGFYYPAQSLKAKFCVEGRHALMVYLANRHIPHHQCGKWVVATHNSGIAKLQELLVRGKANGAEGLRLVERDEVMRHEPHLRCELALLSESTGIVDSQALMLSLHADIERAGGMVALNTSLQRCDIESDYFHLHTADTKIQAHTLINAAGLNAPAVSLNINGLDPAHIPEAYYAKGNYFSCAARVPFSRLVYPVPEAAGLGIHLTLDLSGRARFGPDVEWITTRDYKVDLGRMPAFYKAIRTYWPGLAEGALRPDYAGIRPKLTTGEQDFRIDDQSVHGIPNLINLFGIESPGLTSALAIAEYVFQRLNGHDIGNTQL